MFRRRKSLHIGTDLGNDPDGSEGTADTRSGLKNGPVYSGFYFHRTLRNYPYNTTSPLHGETDKAPPTGSYKIRLLSVCF